MLWCHQASALNTLVQNTMRKRQADVVRQQQLLANLERRVEQANRDALNQHKLTVGESYRTEFESELRAVQMEPEAIAEAYREIRKWVDLNKERLFADTAVSPCVRHGCLCAAHPSLSANLIAELEEEGRPRPIVMNCAGVSCVPCTTVGQQRQHSSACEIPHTLWSTERVVRASRCQEDIFFMECTPRYPFQELAEYTASTHITVSCKMGQHQVKMLKQAHSDNCEEVE
eukprot:5194143-Amphidinium_carterae.1